MERTCIHCRQPLERYTASFSDTPQGPAHFVCGVRARADEQALASISESMPFHTGGVVTDASPVPSPPCAVVSARAYLGKGERVLQRSESAKGWSKEFTVRLQSDPAMRRIAQELREQLGGYGLGMSPQPQSVEPETIEHNGVTYYRIPAPPLGVAERREEFLREGGFPTDSTQRRREFTEHQRHGLPYAPAQLAREREQMRELLRQATQLLGDGEGGELQRQWLAEARQVLGVEGE